jgi:hypothetical protein
MKAFAMSDFGVGIMIGIVLIAAIIFDLSIKLIQRK